MKIAVEGCAHGELDKIYETIEVIESRNNIKVDLLIICGDFQSVRNAADLECMAVSSKYRTMNTFYKYYSGEKVAPILTIFVGGNHEASNYLSELPYGGWVCHNIYYMGYAGVVQVGGIRIAGLSGIYKGHDYMKGHFERLPYEESSKKSVYHVRNVDVFKLKQISGHVDICISHDWPRGIHQYGNVEKLLRYKPFFKSDIDSNRLGSMPAEELLQKLKPSYWFAAHLHCKFSAIYPHTVEGNHLSTKFLALDKCLPRKKFLQLLDIGEPCQSPVLEYDPEWLAILKSTDHLLNITKRVMYMPGKGSNERWDFKPKSEEIIKIMELFNYNLIVPLNFSMTAPIYCLENTSPPRTHLKTYSNPQTDRICKILDIRDPISVKNMSENLTISGFSGTNTDSSFCSPSRQDDEYFSDDDDDEVIDDNIDISSNIDEINVDSTSDFVIDIKGTNDIFVIDKTGENEDDDSDLFIIDNSGAHNDRSIKSSSSFEDLDAKLITQNSTKNSLHESLLGITQCSTDLPVADTDNYFVHQQTFLPSQLCSTPISDCHKPLEQFPKLKQENLTPQKDSNTTPTSGVIKLKRRNLSLYNSS